MDGTHHLQTSQNTAKPCSDGWHVTSRDLRVSGGGGGGGGAHRGFSMEGGWGGGVAKPTNRY